MIFSSSGPPGVGPTAAGLTLGGGAREGTTSTPFKSILTGHGRGWAASTPLESILVGRARGRAVSTSFGGGVDSGVDREHAPWMSYRFLCYLHGYFFGVPGLRTSSEIDIISFVLRILFLFGLAVG